MFIKNEVEKQFFTSVVLIKRPEQWAPRSRGPGINGRTDGDASGKSGLQATPPVVWLYVASSLCRLNCS